MNENIKIILVLFGLISFISIYKSISFLKKGAKTYYPFEVYFPKSGFWSVILYLMIILFFSICIYIVFKFNITFYKT